MNLDGDTSPQQMENAMITTDGFITLQSVPLESTSQQQTPANNTFKSTKLMQIYNASDNDTIELKNLLVSWNSPELLDYFLGK